MIDSVRRKSLTEIVGIPPQYEILFVIAPAFSADIF